MTNTYRAACWTSDDCQAEVRLTSEEHAALPDAELLAVAQACAEEIGLDLDGGDIVIGDFTE